MEALFLCLYFAIFEMLNKKVTCFIRDLKIDKESFSYFITSYLQAEKL